MVSWKMEHFDAMVSRWSAETLQLCWIRGHEDMTDQGGEYVVKPPFNALPKRCHALLKSCHALLKSC